MAVYSRNELHNNGMAHMWLTLALSILQLLPTPLDTAKVQGQGFVQSDFNELRHLVEGVALKGDLSNQGLNNIHDKNSVRNLGVGLYKQWNLSLFPPMLDFGEHAIGMPEIATVQVLNRHPEDTLRMISISGSTPHFHCSFFRDKVVLPGDNTTFEIVFLPRVPGNAENTIFIHTTAGISPYQVFGVGVPNPYRLRPFLGARVPINTSYSPLITMHNPYSSGLMVTEMYSSGGELHLELPTGSLEAPQNLWEIPPFTTRSVMRASFTGQVESNHTAFIRIRTNHSKSLDEEENELLMLPVEVEVSSAPGIYSSLEMLDFGTLRSLDTPKTLPIYLLNSSPKSVQITSVTPMRSNSAMTIDFQPQTLKPSDMHTKVAEVTFHPLRANLSRLWTGKIIIKTKEKHFKLQIPYQSSVLQGTLSCDQQSRLFYLTPRHVCDSSEPVVKPVVLTNNFNFTLVIHQASFPEDVQNIFQVSGFHGTLVIGPQETDTSLSITFTPNKTTTALSTSLQLGSNASVFSMRVHVYTGKIQYSVHTEEANMFDYNVMSVGDQRSMYFTLVNTNPVDIPIQSFSCSLDDCEAQVLGVEPEDGMFVNKENEGFSIKRKSLVIYKHHFAVLRLDVKAPMTEGQFLGHVFIETPHEQLTIEAKLRTVEGCLGVKPESIVLTPAFPGSVQVVSLMITNGFSYRMTLDSIRPDPPDKRFYHKLPKKMSVIDIEPQKKLKIGKIVFDPKLACDEPEMCYVGLPAHTLDGRVWLSSLALPDETQDVDRLFYNLLHNRWLALEQMGKTNFNTTLKVNSNLVKNLDILITATLEWPRLVCNDQINFPLTYIQNSSISEVQIKNPSDSLIIVQLLPIALYHEPTSVLTFLSDRFDPELIETDDPGVFFLANDTDKGSSGKCLQNSSCGAIEETLGITPNRTALTIAIKPHQNVTVAIGFKPTDSRERISLVLIRNNLTILDAFMVRGQGARGELRFNSKIPSASSNLLFELKSTHLLDCDRSSPKARVPPNFTVKRSFMLKNTGQLPIHIQTFQINGYDCDGYGFRVLQCRPLELEPNETKRLDIAFTPDFTMSRITRQLKVLTYNQEELEYTLIATLPPHMLSVCATALPRPQWEHLLYIISIILMGILFLGILTASYLDALRLTEPAMTAMACHPDGGHSKEVNKLKRFDLRNIAAGIKIGEGGGGVGGGGGDRQSLSGSVLSSIGEKLPFRSKSSSSSPLSGSSVANNTRHSEPKSQSERRLSPDKDRVKVNSWVSGSSSSVVFSSATKHSNGTCNSVAASNSSTPSPSGVAAASSARKPGKGRRRVADPDWNNDYTNNNNSSNAPHPDYTVESLSATLTEDAQRRDDYLAATIDVDVPTKLARNKRKTTTTTTTKQQQQQQSKHDETEKKSSGAGRRKEEMMDRDDSSSISTECSNAESDPSDKSGKQTYHQADNKPTWAPTKTKRKASSTSAGSANNNGSSGGGGGGMGLDDFKFEDVKSRTKPRKSAKLDQAFYGDVCRPSTLELPYVPHSEASRRIKQNSAKEPTSPHSIAAKVAAKAAKKQALKIPKAEHVTKPNEAPSEAASTPNSELDKDSPPPLWEQAKPMPSSQGRQLPVQAKHPDHRKDQNQQHRGKNSKKSSAAQYPDAASAAAAAAAAGSGNGGRPSSYSNAVAGAVGSEGGPDAAVATETEKVVVVVKKTKLAKTKSMPEKISAFTAVGESAGHPGAIGNKTTPNKTKTWPWTNTNANTGPMGQSETTDSTSDTSSTASTGPSSPGVYNMPAPTQPKMRKPMSADSHTNNSPKFLFSNQESNPYPTNLWGNLQRDPRMVQQPHPPPMPGFNMTREVQPPPPPRNQSMRGPIGDWRGVGSISGTPSSPWQPEPDYTNAGWSTETGSPRSPTRPSNLYLSTATNPWSFEDMHPNHTAPSTSWNSTSELFPSIWSTPGCSNTSLLDSTPTMDTQESQYSPFNSMHSLWGSTMNGLGRAGPTWNPANDHKQ